MKSRKMLALTLAVAMVAMIIPGKVYAGYKDETIRVNAPDNNQVNDGNNYGTIAIGGKGDTIGTKDVTIKVEKTTDSQEKFVYAVAIDKTDLSFKFQGGNDELIWNPETLKYEKKAAGTTTGAWQNTTATIEVRNYSNVAVSVESTVATMGSGVDGVTVDVDHKAGDPLKLASAAPTDASGVGTVQTGNITVTVAGTPTAVGAFGLTDAAKVTLTVKDDRQ